MSSIPVFTSSSARVAATAHARTAASTPGGRLLVRGEPGLGRTTLLAEAMERASGDGIRVLVARGSRDTSPFPHSGLIDLFAGVSPAELRSLADAQRDAVEIALSRQMATHDVRPLTLRVAVTSVVVGLLERGPVAVVVDDWSLLDSETTGILGWLFTRPGPASRAALIATDGIGDEGMARLPSAGTRELFARHQIVDLQALEPSECEAMLKARFGHRLSRSDLVSIVRLARGNPLWALETAHGLAAAGSTATSVHSPFERPNEDLEAAATLSERHERLALELGEALLALGRAPQAAVVADRLDALAGMTGEPRTRARAQRLRGLVQVATNELDAAASSFLSGLALVGESDADLEGARLLLEMGRLSHRRRSRLRAREFFDRGLIEAMSRGDGILATMFQDELAATRGSANDGRLTASETRIASAVLAGAGNSEVAASQFISVRTVEAHLSAIYRKWGLHSRNQLVAELHRRAGVVNLD